MFSNIYFNTKKNIIHLWEYDKEGVRTHHEIDYTPYAYVYDDKGTYKDLYGKSCRRKEFSDIWSQKEYVKNYATLEGDIQPECRYIVDRYYADDLLAYLPKLHMHIVDIETSADGFPIYNKPECKIYLISVYSTKSGRTTTFGLNEYHGNSDVDYVFCKTEEDLIKNYFKFHRSDYPDILSGWFCDQFDFPYIIQRAGYLLGESFTEKFSPVGDVRLRERDDRTIVEIGGITILDYMQLYKDYSKKEMDAYRLDYISEQELGDKKVPYEGTLDEFRIRDWNGFTDYNIKDVNLVKRIDDKFKFVNLIQGLAYLNRVPLGKVESTSKLVDGYLLSTCKPMNIVLPTAKKNHSSGKIPGGFVMEIKRGFYPKVATYDFKSLYPSIIFALNLSPEMFVGKITMLDGTSFTDIDLEQLIKMKSDIFAEVKFNGVNVLVDNLVKKIKNENLTISANGVIFKNDEMGLIPRVVKGMFDRRDVYKNQMLLEEKLYEETNDISHKYDAERLDAVQSSLKVLANGTYGVLLLPSFRLFNEDFACAITLSGQKINKFTTNKLNDKFFELFGAKDVVIGSDTDSFFVNVQPFVDKYKVSNENFLKAYNLFDEKILKPYNKKCTEEFSSLINSTKINWFYLKKEVVSDGTVLIMKKKYVMRMIEKEGVKYTPYKMKYMGIEIVRSSTPAFCRKKIDDIVVMIIDKADKGLVREKLKEFKKIFKTQNIASISSPRGINNIDDYTDKDGNPMPKCPIQIRASLNYNRLVKKLDLNKKYNYIRNGDKIKFIYIIETPKFHQNIIAFFDELPNEFNLHDVIDYETQFEKSFMSPIQKISESIGWGQLDLNQDDLDSFF
jgi:DNA polymerase elongation subunit (family B)